MVRLRSVFENKRVFVTGHSGFKGAWLTRWLLALGAKVAGYALPLNSNQENFRLPEGVQSLFEELNLKSQITHIEGDVGNLKQLCVALDAWNPDFVFHLAAQSLVRLSYQRPIETFTSNVVGTLNLLESMRRIGRPVIAVIVTSDKVYENFELRTGYSENDRLGGHDPYSSSKAMCELAVTSYRSSFFDDRQIKIATVRAGNVIGGGDWASDRIVPDCIRALRDGLPIEIRNRSAVRPWQHVLEPLGGYLHLAASIALNPKVFCTAFNFGPTQESQRSVAELVESILKNWPGNSRSSVLTGQPRETQVLTLRTEKAKELLCWQGLWDFEQTLAKTVSWYRDHWNNCSAEQLTMDQIERYQLELELEKAK